MDKREQIKRRRAIFPALSLHEAVDQLDRYSDDSTCRTEFLKSLAAYMLDKEIEIDALQIALAYEKQDRAHLQAE